MRDRRPGTRGAVASRSPVVPIALRGTRRVLPADTWLFRRGPIEVIISAPLVSPGRGWQEMVRLRSNAVPTARMAALHHYISLNRL